MNFVITCFFDYKNQILRTAHQKWRGVRFKMGGALLNFEVRLRGEIIILKIKKKYHENQRKKLILMIFVSKEFLIHARTLLSEGVNWTRKNATTLNQCLIIDDILYEETITTKDHALYGKLHLGSNWLIFRVGF
jgi:hypothetical protein